METKFIDENSNPSGENNLFIDWNLKSILLTTTKWTKFLSIVGFVTIGLIVIAALAFGSFLSSTMPDEFAGIGGGLIAFVYILVALFYFFPTWFLFKFSKDVKLGIELEDQELLSSGFNNLKRCFKFIGIFTLIILGLYGIIFIFGILGAALMS